jgi:thiol:disulfide interchange protein DsbD
LSLVATEVFAVEFAKQEEHPVTATLIAEHASVQPGGNTRVGILFELEEGWHIYAKEPGDAGLPTSVAWEGPAGVSFGPLTWPAPQRFLDPGDITTFGYSGTAVLHSPLSYHTVRDAYHTLPLQATVKWLACRELCIPGAARLELGLPVSSQPPVLTTHAQLFEPSNE